MPRDLAQAVLLCLFQRISVPALRPIRSRLQVPQPVLESEGFPTWAVAYWTCLLCLPQTCAGLAQLLELDARLKLQLEQPFRP